MGLFPMSNRMRMIRSMISGSACTQPTRRPVAMIFENVLTVITPCPRDISESVIGGSCE